MEDNYQKIIEDFEKKYFSLRNETKNTNCSFMDIGGNLYSSLKCSASLMITQLDQKDFWERMFDMSLKYNKIYYELLQRFPDFKKGEITSIEGSFPDLYKQAYSYKSREEQKKLFNGIAPNSVKHYVHLCKKRLENNL